MTRLFCFYFTILSILNLSCETEGPSQVLDFAFEKIDLPISSNIRGLSSISDSTFWISGSGGLAAHVALKIDGVELKSIDGFEQRDFRDIHGWNDLDAITMSVGDSAIFLKTNSQWSEFDTVFADFSPGVFIDAFDFEGDHGIAYGDALNNVLYILESFDAGKSWKKIDGRLLPGALPGEGGFAASGTNVDLINGNTFITTGAGTFPRVISRKKDARIWESHKVPLQSGSLNGGYSIVFKNSNEGIVVGGSFQDSLRADSVCAVTIDGGLEWSALEEGRLPGFRSCVAYSSELDVYLATGRTGVDYSYDGRNWISVTQEGGYFACAFGNECAILVGRGGKCAIIRWSKSSIK